MAGDLIGTAEQRIGPQAGASQWHRARPVASRGVGRVAFFDGQ
jgi:hypothetical protein